MMTTINRPSWCLGFGGVTFQDNYYELSPDDSERWLMLISRAYSIAPDLADRLQYIRNTGAQLMKSDEYGYKIVPVIGPDGWESREFYERERECLVKYGKQVVELLKGLGAEK
jgi:hypothetical protein